MKRDAEGYLYFTGRNDDIITSAGYRIGQAEVENILIEHMSVAEAAVVGKPDPERTEIVKAFVVLRGNTEPSEEPGGGTAATGTAAFCRRMPIHAILQLRDGAHRRTPRVKCFATCCANVPNFAGAHPVRSGMR